MKFNYQAKTPTGEIQEGIVEATSKEVAISLLQEKGLFITSLEEEKVPFYARRLGIFERITRKDIVTFSREMAVMLKSNVPIVEVLQTLTDQTSKPNLKEKIFKVSQAVEGGSKLSEAFGLYPDIFNTFYISMVKSGETLGKLSETFEYLAEHLEREYHFYGKIKSALFYPVFVLVVFVIIVAIMIIFVIPQLTQILKESGQAIPFLTRLVIWVSDFLRSWWWILVVVVALLTYLLYRYSKTEKGKEFFDENLLKLPFIGSFSKKIYLSRIASNLSTLISGGLPIAQALEITGEVVGNDAYKKMIFTTKEEVKKGEAISAVFKRYPEIVSALFVQMVIVGEKTGALDETLMKIVDFYQKETDRALESFISLLEPLMIVILGVMVAGLMAAVILPLYQSAMI